MAKCQNNKSLFPTKESEKYHMVWFDCGHYEHLSCWKSKQDNWERPSCPNGENLFPIVIAKRLIGTRVTTAKSFQKVSDSLLEEMEDDPVKVVTTALKKYKIDQYEFNLFELEPYYDQFFALPYWENFVQHYDITIPYRKLLLSTVENNNIKILESILPKIRVIDTIFDLGWGYLHYAAVYGHEKVAELLLGAGADPEIANKRKLTPLHYACRYGHVKVAKLLLEAGANPDQTDQYGKTPLHEAVEGRQLTAIALLIKHQADLEIEDERELSPEDLLNELGEDDEDQRLKTQIEKIFKGEFELAIMIKNPLKWEEPEECQSSPFTVQQLKKITQLDTDNRKVLCDEMFRLASVYEVKEDEGESDGDLAQLLVERLADTNMNCVYCLEDYTQDDDCIYLTDCLTYHVKHLKEYMRKQECPNCRKVLLILDF